MNKHFANKHLPLEEQDRTRVLFFFFLLLPFSALFPHAHLAAALWLFLILFVGAMTVSGKALLRLPRTSFPFCALLLLTAAGAVNATRATLLAVFLRLSFFLPALFWRRREDFCRILAFLGALLGALALLQLWLGRGAVGYDDARLFATLARASFPFGNPNLLAAFLLPCALLALDRAACASRGRWLYLGFAALALCGIGATFSRGAMLAAFVGCLWLLMRRYGVFLPVLTLFSILPWACLLLPESLLSRIASLGSVDSSASYRLSLWKSVSRLSPCTLLFGVGEGKEALLSLLSPVLLAGLSRVEHTHSLYLHLLLGEGVFALLLFLWCAYLALRRAPQGVAAALLSLLVFGIFDDPLYAGQTEVLFWFLLGFSQSVAPSS